MAFRELSITNLFRDANLQGYWKLEDLNDSGANGYTLTNNGSCTFSAAKFSNGVNVASSGTKYLSRSNASGIANLITTGSHTFVLWIKAPSETPEGNVIAISNGGATSDDIYISAGVAHMRRTGLTTNTDVGSSETMTSNTWYFVAGVYSSAESKLKIWVNDKKTEVTASGSGNTLTSPNLNIGASGGGANLFDGIIDDAAFFDRALTDDEVLALYNYGNSKELSTNALYNDSNLRGYWKFESNANDSSSDGYNLTTSGSPAYATGKFGNGIDLEQTSSQFAYITNGSSSNLNTTGSRSVSCWVKLESLQDGAYIFNKDGVTSGWLLYLGGGGDNPGFYIRGLTPSGLENTPPINVGLWANIVGVYDSANSKIKVFVNGIKTEVTVTSGSSSSNVLDTCVGAKAGTAGVGTANYFDGIIDDLAFWDRALTDDEAVSIYNSASGYTNLLLIGVG